MNIYSINFSHRPEGEPDKRAWKRSMCTWVLAADIRSAIDAATKGYENVEVHGARKNNGEPVLVVADWEEK